MDGEPLGKELVASLNLENVYSFYAKWMALLESTASQERDVHFI